MNDCVAPNEPETFLDQVISDTCDCMINIM